MFVVPDDDDAIDAAMDSISASPDIDWEYKALDGPWCLNPFLDALRGWAATTDIS